MALVPGGVGGTAGRGLMIVVVAAAVDVVAGVNVIKLFSFRHFQKRQIG
jgi:hypothetical protein